MKPSSQGESFLSAFADYVQQEKSSIGKKWMKLVRESPDVPGALHITTDQLRDHVPELLGDLVDWLRLEKIGSEEKVKIHAASHGRAQWKAGYNISDLIWEIYIIRRVLTESVLEEFAREHPQYSADDWSKAEQLIQDFFHRMTCHSVAQFNEEQQRAIEKKNQELKETNEARERLTRTVSHELRNVLNALTLTTSLLGEEAEEDQRRDLGVVCSRMLADMSGILSDLLSYSALIAGQAHLVFERISLPGLFEEIVSQWRPVALGLGMTFEMKCDPELGVIFSDKLKLKQIAGNLISNAIKYRKPNQPGYVGLFFFAETREHWKMVVVDTGIGIAREDMDLLFGEFSRIRPSSAVSGSGLGLSICKEFSELLGGRIEAVSEAGKGTRFEILLPLSEEIPATAEDERAGGIQPEIADAGQPTFQII